MVTANLLIICTTVVLTALVGFALIAWPVPRRQQGPSRVGQRVNVHTKQPDYQLLHGVVAGDYADRIVLEHAEYVTDQGVTPLSVPQHIATADISRVEVFAPTRPHRVAADAAVGA